MNHYKLTSVLVLAGLFLACGSSSGDEPWKPLFRGIEYRSIEKSLEAVHGLPVRKLRAHAVRIDTTSQGIRFVATPGNGELPLETNGETVGEFITASGAQLAINSGFFGPCCEPKSGQPKDLIGFAMNAGELVSPAQQLEDRTVESLLIDTEGSVRLAAVSEGELPTGIAVAASGFPRLITDGKVVFPAEKVDGFNGPNPRTAVGLGPGSRFLYLLVVDGRQPDHSDGTTLYETGQLLLDLGATEGVNLDGGGSTVMATLGNDGKPHLLSRPSGGRPRVNAAHFGVVAEKLSEAASPANE